MTHLYLTSNDVKLGIRQGRLTVKQSDGSLDREIPFSNIESINVFGTAQISTQLVRECLTSDISIGYYTEDGHYFGKTSSFEKLDPERQRLQVLLSDEEPFCLAWSKRIVDAKKCHASIN